MDSSLNLHEKHAFLEPLSSLVNSNGQYAMEELSELYKGILFLEYEAVITILSFVILLVWCFSNVKSKKYKIAESWTIPLMALLLFKYIVLFYTITYLPFRSNMAFPFGRVHICPRLVWLFLDMISGCGFLSIFYKYDDTMLEYNGFQILSSIVLPYMVILEFYLQNANNQVLYQALNSTTISRISIYFQCFLFIHIIYLVLMQWKKKGLKSDKLFLIDGCWTFFKDIHSYYFAKINKDKSDG